jgi:predicted ArsR family transcriptional regulator
VKTELSPDVAATSHDTEAGTRGRVLGVIMARGAATAAEIAEEFTLTQAAVRRHLTALTEDGLITTRERRSYGSRGRGRPAKVFVPTDHGRDAFEHSYDKLAIDLLSYLAEQDGPEAVEKYARHRFAAFASEHSEEISSSASPVDALARILTADGYMATVQPVSSGQQLCQHHCPVAAVAATYPVLCLVETEVFSSLLGSHVQRLATIAHGDGVCTTHIPRPVTKEVSR